MAAKGGLMAYLAASPKKKGGSPFANSDDEDTEGEPSTKSAAIMAAEDMMKAVSASEYVAAYKRMRAACDMEEETETDETEEL